MRPPTALAATHINARDPTGNWSIVSQQINSIQDDLGDYGTSANSKTHVPARQLLLQQNPFYFQNRRSALLQRTFALAPLPHTANQMLCLPREFTEGGCHPWGIHVQNPQLEGSAHAHQPGPRSFGNQGCSYQCVEGRGDGRFTRYLRGIGA